METTRRLFLKTVAAGTLGTTILNFDPLGVFADDKINFKEGIKIDKGYYVLNAQTQKTLNALCEIYYPRAREINISRGFLNYFSNPENTGEAGFFDAGLWNLDSIAHSKFNKPYHQIKDNKQKLEVLNHVYSRNRYFIERLKTLSTMMYFSNPRICSELGYQGPPQPKGFMNYTKPPV